MLDVTEAGGLAEAAWEELIYNHEIVVPVLVMREEQEVKKKQHYKPTDRKVERNVEEIQKMLSSGKETVEETVSRID